MLTPGAEMGQFNQSSTYYGLLNLQPGYLNNFNITTSVPVNTAAPIQLQLPPNFNSYPDACYVQSCLDNFQIHQNKKSNKNQQTSNFGIIGEIQVLYSISTHSNNMNSFLEFGAVKSGSFEATIQTQQINNDVKQSLFFGALILQQKFNSSTQDSGKFQSNP